MMNNDDRSLLEYYGSRYPFALIDGKVVWAHDEECNLMSTYDWLVKKHGMTEDQFEETIHGSVYADRVTLCIGGKYQSVDMDTIPQDLLCVVSKRAREFFGSETVEVYNGCIISDAGAKWLPRTNLGVFAC